MTSPADTRVGAALGTPSGFLVPSGLRKFLDTLRGPESATAFDEWRREGFTQLLYLALLDMVLHQPKEVQSDSVLVQLGVTQGLSLAAQLIADPSVVCPGVFDAEAPSATPVSPRQGLGEEDFAQPAL